MDLYASEQQLIDAIGAETESEDELDYENSNLLPVFDDAEYLANEDYNRSSNNDYTPLTARLPRANRVPFVDMSACCDFEAYSNTILKSKTNLPESFNSRSTPLQYFSLFILILWSKM